ncbi:alpha/beta fold hydrolase [Azohydromonas lata]|uniref:alpha/beta fold hydrolase n=1 Tax=Azohydromonas lata TaxID=45677 RepID=UPI00082D83B7|nr:alpha/beta hydrolase [Azohydromonas lata]
MSIFSQHNVKVIGNQAASIVFMHGYGCDQQVWRHVAPAFAQDHRIVLFDLLGSAASNSGTFDRHKYANLEGYARDLIEVCRAADLKRPVLVGHSISAMIAIVAARMAPDLFDRLVLLAPNPCYLKDGNYDGGFSREDIDQLLDTLDSNFFSWAHMMAPVIMNAPERPELAEELANRFCAMDPRVARHFAKVTFLSDCRHELSHVQLPCLVLQCSDDALAPLHVGEYLCEQLPHAELVVMRATGHCPHLSAPQETIELIRRYLVSPVSQPEPAR